MRGIVVAGFVALVMTGGIRPAMSASYSVTESRTYSSDGSDFSYLQLPDFDTSLGTLTEIAFNLNAYMWASIYPPADEIDPPPTLLADYSLTALFESVGGIATSGEITIPLSGSPPVYSVGAEFFTSPLAFAANGAVPLTTYDALLASGQQLEASAYGYVIPATGCGACDPTETLLSATVSYAYDVPEPASVLLFGSALLGLAIARRYGVTTIDSGT